MQILTLLTIICLAVKSLDLTVKGHICAKMPFAFEFCEIEKSISLNI